MHKLTAGSGYDYLTRQVAAADSTEKGHTSLAAYYTEKGEAPGLWVGSGMAGIDGLDAGDIVAAEQMRALFGSGHHPLAHERQASLADDATDAQVHAVTRLGTPFKVHAADVPTFQVDVARRLEEVNVAAGRPRAAAVDLDDRARVRSEVAREYFVREHGREPVDARELAATIAKHSRPRTTAVAGFDLTFSPVKSVSALWAVADPQTAAKIELAHESALKDALAFIEREALFTRTGTNGTQQVDVTGLVAAAFTHRDSRAGDPDLHTHVAVSNKVQTLDGRWLAVDGRVLYKAKVTASETYNTALERHLSTSLGVRFVERAGTDPRKRPIREIVGIDPILNQRWSRRRASIEVRQAELAVAFQHDHGRPPTPVEAIQLAQRATLETRDAKHEPRSLVEQRRVWRAEAIEALGSPAVVDHMVATALSPAIGVGRSAKQFVTTDWVSQTAAMVIAEVEGRRSTWQVWHVRSEAQRQVRTADITAAQVEVVVDLIVDEALGSRSVALTTDRDQIIDPVLLRRSDGSSVYHVAGSDLFTSRRVLAAEVRIVDAAGRTDGRRVAPECVDIALLESTANGVELNAGQACMVRQMATSGARVQLGIAAAGTGKTTAMSVLTKAWEESGGTVVGLAPSAAAAAALREQTGATTDTLAKLIHAVESGQRSGMLDDITGGALVLIDEAGMGDTLALDAAISFVLGCGASVRLIGDDQQLAAIGAGGVLRDIDRVHGSLRLGELMRFADPAEGAATLALREGLPESLGFYLDRDRVHVGDLATLIDRVFANWTDDRAAGLDSIMLAPTRDLVHELNARARTARLADDSEQQGPAVRLADGNEVSAGDIVITRNNDRRLRVSATDWVKNGDRWKVTSVERGRVFAQNTANGLRVILPGAYVAEHTELGYASTVHTAQGVSVDTMHGLATGDEVRQQFYTMMTRGRLGNDVYLVLAGDGDPHNLIRPETIHPKTATDVLENILAHDGSPKSATTMVREASDPAVQLGQAAARYTDALYVGAENLIGNQRATAIEQTAESLVPGISDEPAWPVLRAHLLVVEAQGRDATRDLSSAVAERELDGVKDRAAILDWRLDPTGLRGSAVGPLPWLPTIPAALTDHPTWGPYLAQRATQVETLATKVSDNMSTAETPAWARQGGARPGLDVLAAVAVWRAATGVPADDRRPTGAPHMQKAAAAHQRHLNERISAGKAPALAEWGPTIDRLHPQRDQFTAVLAERLAAISRTGLDAATLFASAAAEGPLPDDHVAAAMWWRISRRLSPAVATEATAHDTQINTNWSDLLIDVLGSENAAQVTASRWWPTLVASVDHVVSRGWSVTDLFDIAKTVDADDVELAQAMVWRIAIVTDPPPEPDAYGADLDERDAAPADLDEALTPGGTRLKGRPAEDELAEMNAADLAPVMLERDLLDPLEPSAAGMARTLDNAFEWDHSPVPRNRILAINEMAADYYEHHLAGSWAHTYLQMRFGQDLTGDERFRPGFAPPGWANLIDQLRSAGVRDDEMLAAGVAKAAKTGRLIDRFRDRAVLPIISNGQVLGFVGRRHPDVGNDTVAGPKYLNTPDTIVFHKGAQLYGLADATMADGSIPVLVEGPMDAIAITLATAGAYVGVAPLGTSLTNEQAAQLGGFSVDPIVATDGDLAGRIAAERDYWLLTRHGLDPRFADLAPGDDPANMLTNQGATPLRSALHNAALLADTLVDERVTNITDTAGQVAEAATVIAAQPPSSWDTAITCVSERASIPADTMSAAVADAGSRWNADRRRVSNDQLGNTSTVRARLERATEAKPADRWAQMARALDVRLISQPDWAATAAMLQEIHDAGHDVPALTRQLVNHTPLGESPAQDLRYRLVGYLPDDSIPNPQHDGSQRTGAEQQLRVPVHPAPSSDVGPRR